MDTTTSQENPPKKHPEWLINIQNNSWNPELLISGISIVFLFSISGKISEFNILLIQRYGLNPVLVYFASIYVSLAFTALQYLFAFHLVLRGIWVGWVGLSYVFPQGIRIEKLPKMSQMDYIKKEIGDPIDKVMLLERVCSSTFSLAFTFVGLSFLILFFFVITFVLDRFGVNMVVNLGLIFGVLLIIGLVAPLNYYLSKRLGKKEIKFLSAIYIFISRIMSVLFYRDSMMTYQTNLPKVRFVIYAVVIFLPLVILSTNNILKTVEFSSFALTRLSFVPEKDRHKEGVLYNNYYFDRMDKNERIQKASIPSTRVEGDLLELFIADFQWDREVFGEVVKNDTLDYDIGTLVKVKIDGEVIESRWYKNDHPVTHQKGWVSYIPMENFPDGEHELTLDKWLWNYEEHKSQFEESYCIIPFWKAED